MYLERKDFAVNQSTIVTNETVNSNCLIASNIQSVFKLPE